MCSRDIQNIPHNYFIHSAASWQLEPQSNISLHDDLACYRSNTVANLPSILLRESHILRELPSISPNVWGGGTIRVPTLLWRGRFPCGIFHTVVFNCSRHLRRIPPSDGIILGTDCGFGSFHCDWRFTTFHTLAVPDHVCFHTAMKTGRFALAIQILVTLITITALPAYPFAISVELSFGISFCEQ